MVNLTVKKLLSLLLLSIILFYAGGMYLVFHIGENIVEGKARRKMELIANINELVAIKDTGENTSKIQWEKPGREFRFEQQLYDIVTVTYDTEGIRTYHCYADNDETNFLKQTEKIISRCAKGNNSDKTLTLISKVIAMVYLIPETNSNLVLTFESISHTCDNSPVATETLTVPTPPPDQA